MALFFEQENGFGGYVKPKDFFFLTRWMNINFSRITLFGGIIYINVPE
jgi:hypothetical protein